MKKIVDSAKYQGIIVTTLRDQPTNRQETENGKI